VAQRCKSEGRTILGSTPEFSGMKEAHGSSPRQTAARRPGDLDACPARRRFWTQKPRFHAEADLCLDQARQHSRFQRGNQESDSPGVTYLPDKLRQQNTAASSRANLTPSLDWRAPIRMLTTLLSVLSVMLVPTAGAGAHLHSSRAAASLRTVTGASGVWWIPATRKGSVRGGSLLTFAGSRFDLSTPYVARFTGVDQEAADDPTLEVEAAPTLATSFTQLVIAVPAWPGHESNVTVSLHSEGIANFVPASGNSTMFEYISQLSSIEGSTVQRWHPPSAYTHSFYSHATVGLCKPVGAVLCSSPVSGGAVVTVHGAGFQQRECPENQFCIDVRYTLRLSSTADATKIGEKTILPTSVCFCSNHP